MNIDLSALQSLVENGVPFAHKTGVQVVSVEGGEVTARLELEPQNTNHIGTMHAAALFTLGETTAGMALYTTIDLSRIVPIARSGAIQFRKPARMTTFSRARIDPQDAARATTEFESKGKADLEIRVRMHTEEFETVAEFQVVFALRPI